MNDAQLDKLSKLLPLWETCAKMGGTPILTSVQQAVTEDLQVLLAEIDEQRKKDYPLRPKTPHEVTTSGNAIPTNQPLPEGVDEKGRPLRPDGTEHKSEEQLKAEAEANARGETVRTREEAAERADYERRMRESRERALHQDSRLSGTPERRA